MTDRFVTPVFVALDGTGNTVSGAKLFFYESGTTTAKNTFSDESLTTANPNPLIADFNGRFGDIFLGAGDYKVVLKDAFDGEIWTRDPVTGTSTSTSTLTDADGDTKVQVEESADDDTIRFDAVGKEIAKFEVSSGISQVQFFDDQAGATAGPSLRLWRDSATPAVNDEMGEIVFQGEDSTGAKTDYAKIVGRILDPTNTAEDGMLDLRVYRNAGERVGLRIQGGTTHTQVLFGEDGNESEPALSWIDDPDTGFYRPSTNQIGVALNGELQLLFANGPNVQLSNDNIAHGMTTLVPTDVGGLIGVNNSAVGALALHGYSEDQTAQFQVGYATSPQTTDTTSTLGVFRFDARKKSGTSFTSLATNEAGFTFQNNSSGIVLFKGDGTVHASDTSWATALDTEDDIAALRMLDRVQSTKGVMESAWDSMIGDDWEYLQSIGVAGGTNPEKGRPDMFAIQPTIKLTMGAVWYLAQNFMAFLEAQESETPGVIEKFHTIMREKSGRAPMLMPTRA